MMKKSPYEAALKCRVLVMKVASRCNLNCSYCYMYNMGDSTYRDQPKVMSNEVVDAILHRTRKHCLEYGISKFLFVFHGGEPLLAGSDFFIYFTKKAREVLLPEIKPEFDIQTNGVLIDEEWCTLLGELGINVGVSLDGTREDNDRFRTYHNGKGSYNDIVKGLAIANNHTGFANKPGVISVINVNADPLQVYRHFQQLGISAIDFLMPDSTYDQPPPRSNSENSETPYADWLIKIFDEWFYEQEVKPQIRVFNNIIRIIMGKDLYADNLGTQNNEVLVIETNGNIEAVDVLKICGDGFTKAGANVLTHNFDESMQTDLARLFHMSHTYLCKICLGCPVKDVCGGGYLPHRYSRENGFNNPSVYCKDLMKLITHIQNALFDELPTPLLEMADIGKMTYESAAAMLQENLQLNEEPDYKTELEHFSVR